MITFGQYFISLNNKKVIILHTMYSDNNIQATALIHIPEKKYAHIKVKKMYTRNTNH